MGLETIDVDTGEVVAYSLVAVPKKLHNAFSGGWLAMAQDAMIRMAKEIKSLDDFRVLHALLGRLDFENLIQVPQVEIANQLDMKRPNVSRSIKRLLGLGILLQGPKIGTSRTYRLNPNYGWKGSSKNHHKALRIQERAAQAGLSVHQGGKAQGQE